MPKNNLLSGLYFCNDCKKLLPANNGFVCPVNSQHEVGYVESSYDTLKEAEKALEESKIKC